MCVCYGVGVYGDLQMYNVHQTTTAMLEMSFGERSMLHYHDLLRVAKHSPSLTTPLDYRTQTTPPSVPRASHECQLLLSTVCMRLSKEV